MASTNTPGIKRQPKVDASLSLLLISGWPQARTPWVELDFWWFSQLKKKQQGQRASPKHRTMPPARVWVEVVVDGMISISWSFRGRSQCWCWPYASHLSLFSFDGGMYFSIPVRKHDRQDKKYILRIESRKKWTDSPLSKEDAKPVLQIGFYRHWMSTYCMHLSGVRAQDKWGPVPISSCSHCAKEDKEAVWFW